MTIGQNIRMFRKKRGLSQGQLGRLIGMTGGAISSYENGTTTPKRRIAEKIALVLDVPTEKIMGETAPVPIGGGLQGNQTGDSLLYDGVIAVLKDLYGIVEGRMVMGQNGDCRKYYIIHHSAEKSGVKDTGDAGAAAESFVLYEEDIAAIAHSAKASLQPVAKYMKRVRGGGMDSMGSGI